MENDIRWKQRFDNFEKAFTSLREIVEIKDIEPDVRIDTAVKRFELSFELAWKTLQDYLYEMGYTAFKGPKQVIGKSFQDNIISNGELWFKMLEDRNTLAHVYDYDRSRLIYEDIATTYLTEMEKLYNKLKNESAK